MDGVYTRFLLVRARHSVVEFPAVICSVTNILLHGFCVVVGFWLVAFVDCLFVRYTWMHTHCWNDGH